MVLVVARKLAKLEGRVRVSLAAPEVSYKVMRLIILAMLLRVASLDGLKGTYGLKRERGQCGYSSKVERQPSKLVMRVRFPLPAPNETTKKTSQLWIVWQRNK